MLRVFAVSLLMFGAPLFADEPSSLKLAAPEDWGGETIELPPGFAPEMKLKGSEHIRFAPGMMKPASDSFFCYAFVFELQRKPDLTEEVVKDEFLKYYRGLCQAVLKGKLPDVDPSKFTLELQQVKLDTKASSNEKAAEMPTLYTGSLDWVEPFATKKPQKLNLEIRTWARNDQNYIFVCVSPQARDAAIWKNLHAIRDDYLKEQAKSGAVAAIEPASEAWPKVFVHRDTCNVYILREGDSAILVNLGDGTVLDHLKEIGVKQIEWILFTDHHREQCQGLARVDRAMTKIAAPKEEQALFETPLQFRKWRPTLADAHTVHGASYVRPPPAPIKLDRALGDGERFAWRGHEIHCVGAPGHSPGGMCYVLRSDGRACAFTGGIMHDGARMTNWFDSEWDYGFGKGLDALIESVQRLGVLKLSWAFPSQGPPIQNAGEQLADYHRKLVKFRPDYLRGYPVKSLTQRMKADPNVKPTKIRQIVQVTPHLYKFSDELAGKNFAIIIADSGRGVLLDCGIFPELLLHDLIKDMQTHLGLKSIDALWINHMHGDHFTLGAVLKKRYGVKIWTLDRIVDKVENPLFYDYCALITSYNPEYEGLKVDRPLRDGEVVEWEGLKLHIDWMPGQTEFGNCLWLELDGKRIAFTGDNLFGDPSDPQQNGHEAVVARNSAIFEEGYLLGSRYLRDLKPDIIMGAHNVLMSKPAAFLYRYHEWSKRIIERYKELLPDPNYEYQFDPFWVSAYPYRVDLQQERSQTVTISVRNFRDQPQQHHIRLRLPPGVSAEPAVLQDTLEPKSRKSFKVKVTADPARVSAGVQMIPLDITLNGKRHGELFDFLFQAKPDEGAIGKDK